MIACARKAFPGMLVSLMLSVPAIANTNVSRGNTARASNTPAHGYGIISKNNARKPQATCRAAARSTLPATQRPPLILVGARMLDQDTAYEGRVWSDGSGAWREVGRASWYGGPRWHGKLTSSGQRYDERALTAAHATLPLGTRVRVTVSTSGRSVLVVVTDRPGTRSRIIDLSRAAAIELGIIDRGVVMVSITRD